MSAQAAAQAGTQVLFPAAVEPQCVASVVIPVRNEEQTLDETLDALRDQVDLDGHALAKRSYEILLLLNNCTDRSLQVAERYRDAWPALRLYVAACTYEAHEAHVGTARKALMDAACARMEEAQRRREPEGAAQPGAVLTTDADTRVAPDWIARTRDALRLADAVGGEIRMTAAELARMDSLTRAAYLADKRYQQLAAELEARLDPDPADPWPRHRHHFGGSLACTCRAYRACGGMPAIKPLEDVAFIERLRRAGCTLRHAPEVAVFTSARLDGRAEVGLSGQLQIWQQDRDRGVPHMVESAGWLAHRFGITAALRAYYGGGPMPAELGEPWRTRAHAVRLAAPSAHGFLCALDADTCLEETFSGIRHEEIAPAIAALEEKLAPLRLGQR